MGMTYIKGVASGTDDQRVTVRFLVDSGATYSLLPYDDWRAIGLVPKRSMTFSLADGTAIERQISECHIEIAQGEGHTPVILGEPGDQALLGVVTLEILGLVLNPVPAHPGANAHVARLNLSILFSRSVFRAFFTPVDLIYSFASS